MEVVYVKTQKKQSMGDESKGRRFFREYKLYGVLKYALSLIRPHVDIVGFPLQIQRWLKNDEFNIDDEFSLYLN